MLEDREASHAYRILANSLPALVRKVHQRKPEVVIQVRASAFENYVVLSAECAEDRNLIRHCILGL